MKILVIALVGAALLSPLQSLAQLPDVSSAVVGTPATPGPKVDPVQIAKELITHKQYASVVSLVSTLQNEVVSIAQKNDALYQQLLKANLEMSNLKEKQIMSDVGKLKADKQEADHERSQVIAAIEQLSPGMKWDESQGKLVTPPGPKLTAEEQKAADKKAEEDHKATIKASIEREKKADEAHKAATAKP